ncbi:integrase domain-containing protein [Caballeronia calidae]|uniref:Integrase domain-containing protein n=1 Tax=Caballeronia calidae TaxID=1777139 RepID=A0A158EJA9_9BURK|nr:tyrosine-type recombinase/integrase [Caballeronia calidae]SAL06486.1 integrase domain-containing protein [Caballeronia calidae]
MSTTVNFGSVLTRFIIQRLMKQRHVSEHTIGSYRDTFRLLLKFVHARTGKQPSNLLWADIDAPLISAFLDDLQERRGITARSRNLRLAAIHSLFRYASFELPEYSSQIQRVLAIPSKRITRRQIGYLTRRELDALLDATDQSTWSGRRDYAWLLLAAQTGLRLSELTGLTREDVHLGTGAYVHVTGKGRRGRCTPLTEQTAPVLQAWLKELPLDEAQVVFPNRRGTRMSNDGIQYLLARHADTARKACASLKSKHITPNVLRHSAAMSLLHAGYDTTVIAMWLGHDSVETTHIYLEADLELKRKMLEMTTPSGTTAAIYKPGDALMAFLQSL